MRRRVLLVFCCLIAGVPSLRAAEPPLVAALGACPLLLGGVIRDCRLEYRTVGTLNAARSNAVLFPTWFSGRTEQLLEHAGPGRMLDPTRDYVIFVGAFGNGRSSSPSNSPAQADAAFPSLTIGDMVVAEHRLVTEVLHLDRLNAVVGISMGGMQVFEWAVRYPGFARHLVPIVGTPRLSSYDLLLWRTELGMLDLALPAQCDERLRARVMASVGAVHELALSTPGHVNEAVAAGGFDGWLASREAEYVREWSPYDWSAQLRAMIGQDVGRWVGGTLESAAARVTAPLLAVVAVQDHMVNPDTTRQFVSLVHGQLVELTGACGHLAPGCEQPKVDAAVRAFLTQ